MAKLNKPVPVVLGIYEYEILSVRPILWSK